MGAVHLEVRNVPSPKACWPCFKWLAINMPINTNNQDGETSQGKVLEGAASRLIQPQYHLHHLADLADSHPELMPAQTPQLLLQIGRHQQEENQEGRGFELYLGIACQM